METRKFNAMYACYRTHTHTGRVRICILLEQIYGLRLVRFDRAVVHLELKLHVHKLQVASYCLQDEFHCNLY